MREGGENRTHVYFLAGRGENKKRGVLYLTANASIMPLINARGHFYALEIAKNRFPQPGDAKLDEDQKL